jgi:hypothetical protein
VQWTPEAKPEIASVRTVSYEWVGDTARHAGTVVHEFLRRFGEGGVEGWTTPAIEAQRGSVESELRRMGVARRDLAGTTERVLRALEHSATSERGRWIFEKHTEAQNEWELTGFAGGQLLNATIDRTFVDESGRRWIIVIKTSDHKGGGRTAFLDEEQRRYRDQLDSYAALLRMRDPRPISLGLYFPLMKEWREWEFGEVAAKGV